MINCSTCIDLKEERKGENFWMDQVSSNYEFVEFVIWLIRGDLAPSIQTVGSLLRSPGQPSQLQKWFCRVKKGFDKIPIWWTLLLLTFFFLSTWLSIFRGVIPFSWMALSRMTTNRRTIEKCALKNVINYLNTNIYSYLRHLMVKVIIYIWMLFIFSTPVLIRHILQLKTVVFLCWCLIHAVLMSSWKSEDWQNVIHRNDMKQNDIQKKDTQLKDILKKDNE